MYHPPLHTQVLTAPERERLADNLAGHMVGAQDFIQQRAVANFAKADPALGKALTERLNKLKTASRL